MVSIPSEFRFVCYVLGIYVAFVNWGLLQEKLMTFKYGKEEGCAEGSIFGHSLFLNLCMGFGARLTAKAAIKVLSGLYPEEVIAGRSKPTRWAYFKASLAAAVASPTGYRALKFVSYPLMVLVKSSKAIPVMVVGMVVYKEKYKWWKYLCVIILASGIGLFMFFEKKHKKDSSEEVGGRLIVGQDWCPSEYTTDTCQILDRTATQVVGVVLLFANLTLDGITNNEQDAINKNPQWHVTQFDMMMWVNEWQAIFLGGYLYVEFFMHRFGIMGHSEAVGASDSVRECPAMALDLLYFCVCASVGQILIFSIIKEFGSLTWITVSVTRKLATVLLSVVRFGHAVVFEQWCGIGLVFASLSFEVFMKYRDASTETPGRAGRVSVSERLSLDHGSKPKRE